MIYYILTNLTIDFFSPLLLMIADIISTILYFTYRIIEKEYQINDIILDNLLF